MRFCGWDYGVPWNFPEQSHIHDETDGNFDGLPAGKYRFLRKYNRNGNSLSGSVYPDSGGTGIPGILFGRLKDMLSKPFAVGISALIFAAVHVNIVQFIYALILGVVLALLMDRAGNVYASMIGHMTANFIAVVRTETHWLDFSVRRCGRMDIFLMILGAGIVLMWRYLSDRKKQEDKEKE